jgi:hypothetical protein
MAGVALEHLDASDAQRAGRIQAVCEHMLPGEAPRYARVKLCQYYFGDHRSWHIIAM